MSKFYSVWNVIRRYKYPITIFGILLIVGFLDENSFWNRQKRKAVMNQLHSEIRENREAFEAADKEMRELDENPKALEKIARERYYMKRDNEDVFVLKKKDDTTSETETFDTENEY